MTRPVRGSATWTLLLAIAAVPGVAQALTQTGISGSALFDATAELVGFRAFADEAGTIPLTSGFEILGSGGESQTIVPEPRAALLLAAAAGWMAFAAGRRS